MAPSQEMQTIDPARSMVSVDAVRPRQLLTLWWLSFLPFSSPKTQYCENRLNQPTPDIFHQLYGNNTNVKWLTALLKTRNISYTVKRNKKLTLRIFFRTRDTREYHRIKGPPWMTCTGRKVWQVGTEWRLQARREPLNWVTKPHLFCERQMSWYSQEEPFYLVVLRLFPGLRNWVWLKHSDNIITKLSFKYPVKKQILQLKKSWLGKTFGLVGQTLVKTLGLHSGMAGFEFQFWLLAASCFEPTQTLG